MTRVTLYSSHCCTTAFSSAVLPSSWSFLACLTRWAAMVISPVSPGPLLVWRTGTYKWKQKCKTKQIIKESSLYMNGYCFLRSLRRTFEATYQNLEAFMVKVVLSKPSLCSLFALWGVFFSVLTEEHEQTKTPLAPIKQILPILLRNNIACSYTGRNLIN